jgi:cysteine-rich repeat protein
VCGNGLVDPGEQCDTVVQTAACDSDCTFTVCGDNHRNAQAGEQCDPGVVGGNTATCDADCTAPVCGDGRVNPQAGEQCDDGNNVDGDGCRSNCTLP